MSNKEASIEILPTNVNVMVPTLTLSFVINTITQFYCFNFTRPSVFNSQLISQTVAPAWHVSASYSDCPSFSYRRRACKT